MRLATWIASVLCLACARDARPALVPPSALEGPQAPADPVRLLDIGISKDRISVPESTTVGPWNISFFNATSATITASLERDGEVWRLDRPIPPNTAVTKDIDLKAGDYKVIAGEGRSRLTAVLHVSAQK